MDSKPVGQEPTETTNAELIARVNAVSVAVDDMLLASREIQKLPLHRCNRDLRTDCLALLFTQQGDKALAIGYRLEAMAGLVRFGKIPRWVRPNMAATVVFRAAATEAVRFRENESFFEAESFTACVREHERSMGVPQLALVPGSGEGV